MAAALSESVRQKIAELSRLGHSQSQICAALRLGRSTVFRYQRQFGLNRHHRALAQVEKTKILTMILDHRTDKQIAAETGIGRTTITSIAREAGLGRRSTSSWDRLSEADRATIVEEIHARANFLRDLADKYGVAYKQVRRVAHAELRCQKFRPGRTRRPLESNFPQREAR